MEQLRLLAKQLKAGNDVRNAAFKARPCSPRRALGLLLIEMREKGELRSGRARPPENGKKNRSPDGTGLFDLEVLGLTKNESSRCQILARIPDDTLAGARRGHRGRIPMASWCSSISWKLQGDGTRTRPRRTRRRRPTRRRRRGSEPRPRRWRSSRHANPSMRCSRGISRWWRPSGKSAVSTGLPRGGRPMRCGNFGSTFKLCREKLAGKPRKELRRIADERH